MNDIIGWIGSLLFAICALPQVIHTFKTRKTDDLNELFLWLWFWGEVFTFTYIIIDDLASNIHHIPLYFNYIFNLILLFYLLFAKYTYNTKPTTLAILRHRIKKNNR
ncbi:PQ-loop repeat-containing protein [Ancylomarina longa]|uniref:PQ-loop repeat-containing protein n=1 Tax=Ancylomarina longa TaxID=2487017 RepID=A0A434AYD2_9BACT|nr:PQ-loop repeat-containing protein [Ancylomarina longa]RUT79582.1 PQ-loop repeat-containing protein [Ancylomarina longa]